MRCPNCEKFVSLEMQDPEVENLEVSGSESMISVSAEARIVRCCADCGEEMKEANLSLELDIPFEEVEKFLKEHPEDIEEIPITIDEIRRGLDNLEVEETSVNQLEEGGGRYAKSYFGASVGFKVTLNDRKVYEGTLEDKVAASEMEELC